MLHYHEKPRNVNDSIDGLAQDCSNSSVLTHGSYCSLSLSHHNTLFCPCSNDHSMPLQPKGSHIGDWCQCLGQISIKISPLGDGAPVLKHGWYPAIPWYLHTWMKIQFDNFSFQIIKKTALSSPIRIPDCTKCLLNMPLFTNFAAPEIHCFRKICLVVKLWPWKCTLHPKIYFHNSVAMSRPSFS